MFLDHFGLSRHPFVEKPPIEWILRDEHIDQILAGLEFFQNQGEIALIIGQTGLGKSTLIRLFIHQLPQNRYNPICLHFTRVNDVASLRSIVLKMGEKPKRGKEQLLLQLTDRINQKRNAPFLLSMKRI